MDESDEMTNGFDDDGTGVEQETSDDEDEDNQIKYSKPVSIIDIVARRRMIIQKAKIQIGSICLNSGDCRDIGGSNRNLLDFTNVMY